MKIAFVRESEILDLNPDVEESKALSATETCFIQLAQKLSRYHTIKVFCPCHKQRSYGSVEFVPLTTELCLAIGLSQFTPDFVIVVGNPRIIFEYKTLWTYKLIFWQHNHPLEMLRFPIQQIVDVIPIVLPSKEARDYAKEYYHGTKIYGVYNGVRDNFLISHRNVIKNKICYVGSLVRVKGLFELITASRQLTEYEFFICGSFDMNGFIDPQFEAQCRNSALENVHFLGGLNKYEVARQVSESELCISNPLKNNGEVCCVSALEAMAIGTPVVAGYSPILEKIVAHGGVCWTDSLKDTIRDLMHDSDKRDMLSRSGREWASNLSYIHIVKQWNDLILQLNV